MQIANSKFYMKRIFGKCKSKQKLTILKKLKLCKLGRAYQAKHIKQRFFQNAQNTPRNNFHLRKLFQVGDQEQRVRERMEEERERARQYR